MNKLLLSSICAVALTSSASAFILNISPLVGQQSGTVTHNPFGNFQISTTGDIVALNPNGRVNLDNGETLTITYPSTVTYQASFLGGNITVSQGANTVSFLGADASVATVDNINFTVNPAPEPSSTALLGLGGLALILRRRK